MDTNRLKSILNEEGIVFLTYGRSITQSLVLGMTEALENEHSDLSQKISTNIFTIFIELSQNIMNYSKSKSLKGTHLDSKDLIVVGMNSEGHYYLLSQNIVDKSDKDKILPKLEEINTLDQDGIRKRYRELRKSGNDKHGRGAGIGFYEIAKRCNKIDYEFIQIDEEKFDFKFKATVHL